MNCALLLDAVTRRFQRALGRNLAGLYVHGSLAFGCFQWAGSDIDLLAVARSAPSQGQKEALIHALLDLIPLFPPKGLEMSVVLLEDCRQFRYPTPFCLHFSPLHLAACRADLPAFCRSMQGVDRDLAAHFTVTRQVGIPLFGPPPGLIFGPVPRDCYLDSIRRDCAADGSELMAQPIYFVLNLCRTLAYLRDGLICSKETGGQWALERLPGQWHALIQRCLDAYRTGSPPLLDSEQLQDFYVSQQKELEYNKKRTS